MAGQSKQTERRAESDSNSVRTDPSAVSRHAKHAMSCKLSQCTICNITFPNTHALRQHVQKQHNEIFIIRQQRKLKRLAKKDSKLLQLCYLLQTLDTYNNNTQNLSESSSSIHNLCKQVCRPVHEAHTDHTQQENKFAKFVQTKEEQEQSDRWFTTQELFNQNQPTSKTHQILSCAHVSTAALGTPDARPTLSIPTFWGIESEQQLCKQALVDTGCNTSLIQSDLLREIVKDGRLPMQLDTPIYLLWSSIRK